MIDLRRIALIFVIAVLFAIFANALIGAFYPAPKYEDYCKSQFYPEPVKTYPIDNRVINCPNYTKPTQAELDQCAEDRGYPEYQYDGNGCAIAYKGCNLCQKQFEDAMEKYNFVAFILSSILAVIAIAIGLALPTKISLNEWIATGFILGGLITLFFGTARYYQYLGRYIKPLVIFVELVLVIALSYMKLKDRIENTIKAKKKEAKKK